MASSDPFTGVSQQEVLATPVYAVDGSIGTASAWGVARITLGAFKLNTDPASAAPVFSPVVTLSISEDALVSFANEVLERAARLKSDSEEAATA